MFSTFSKDVEDWFRNGKRTAITTTSHINNVKYLTRDKHKDIFNSYD